MFTITQQFDTDSEYYTKTIQILGKTYHMAWRPGKVPGHYTAISDSPSFAKQLEKEYPDVPSDEWEEIEDAFEEANDFLSMRDAYEAFLDVLYENGYDGEGTTD
ncbi:MAG: hypothetical protein ACI4OH_05235 [Mitsuokella sp.]|uniref:hypothetical protein n=1 Tax=Mitsuokella sp. TaxID=2049034 RepID=UPI003F0E242E